MKPPDLPDAAEIRRLGRAARAPGLTDEQRKAARDAYELAVNPRPAARPAPTSAELAQARVTADDPNAPLGHRMAARALLGELGTVTVKVGGT